MANGVVYWESRRGNTVAITEVPTKECGFCATRNHENCAVGVKHDGPHSKYPKGVVWVCGCEHEDCGPNRRKCAYCHNRTTEQINPETWECFDVEGCRAGVEAKREADPLHRQLREIEEQVKMAKIENTQEKAEKKAATREPTFCLVTGEPTKGGLFKPGMDARYVSERVTEAINGKFSAKVVEAQRKRMTKDGVSDALKAKFEKSLALAQDKAEKREAAKAEKAAAKADKEKASA